MLRKLLLLWKQYALVKKELLPILSQGVFAVVGGALLQRLPEKLLVNKFDHVQEVFNIPLDGILPLIPPEWFMLQNQDNSLAESLQGMDNPFTDTFAPETETETTVKEESKQEITEEAVSAPLIQEDNEEEISLDIEEDHENELDTCIQESPKSSSLFDEIKTLRKLQFN